MKTQLPLDCVNIIMALNSHAVVRMLREAFAKSHNHHKISCCSNESSAGLLRGDDWSVIDIIVVGIDIAIKKVCSDQVWTNAAVIKEVYQIRNVPKLISVNFNTDLHEVTSIQHNTTQKVSANYNEMLAIVA